LLEKNDESKEVMATKTLKPGKKSTTNPTIPVDLLLKKNARRKIP
jgi:hypothetical protein